MTASSASTLALTPCPSPNTLHDVLLLAISNPNPHPDPRTLTLTPTLTLALTLPLSSNPKIILKA